MTDTKALDFDPCSQADLQRVFVQTPQDQRAAFLSSILGPMADGLKGVSAVANLATIDPGSFVRGTKLCLEQNPRNLTAARALIWFYVRNEYFAEAERQLKNISKFWTNYDEIRLELLRLLIIENSEERTGYIAANSDFFKQASRTTAYELQVLSSQTPTPEITKAQSRSLHDLGMLAFSRMLLSVNVNEQAQLQNEEIDALWQLAGMIGRAKRVALVGNSSKLRDSGLGENIDSHDVVIRCNFPEIRDHHLDVGRKTDLMLFNESIRGRVNKADPTVMQYDTVLALGLHPEPLFGFSEPRLNRKAGITTLPADTRKFISDISYSRSTTGLMAINLLCFVFQKNISLYGFDFYNQIDRPHYFGAQTGAYLGHELQYERWYVQHFLKACCPERFVIY
jgi:hypothetical protein